MTAGRGVAGEAVAMVVVVVVVVVVERGGAGRRDIVSSCFQEEKDKSWTVRWVDSVCGFAW